MKTFEENKSFFLLLTQAVSQGIVIINKEGIIIAASERTHAMFGYSEDEVIGMPIEGLIVDRDKQSCSIAVKAVFNKIENINIISSTSLIGQRKNKAQLPLEIVFFRFQDQGLKYVLALFKDMTVLKNKDVEIHELHSQLELKIKERTRELRDTVAILKKEMKRREKAEAQLALTLQKERELNELKTKFLSLVSHEFKTPLGGILTSATLVGKYKTTLDQEIRDKHLFKIIGAVRHLNSILDDFLSVERLEKGKEVYRKTNFSLSKIVNDVIYNANMLLKSGQRINYPANIDEVIIRQDEKIVSLALTNLLHNAIKYSPEDMEIDVQVVLCKEKVIFHIIDRGIGIPLKDQKHIFERYFRAENVLLTQGTGIGLNIVKTHIENLGGKIYFSSEPEKGSTFSLEFPLIAQIPKN
ncbi:PAS/PAC sensor signal transduction histidine kinase [Arenibacter nanhaiticus]|uniref:histidine kinase n=1 Tax=Arenibacter nanhaiticus TaxID=558155 RepID=A0A1M6E4C3_9FLAO|nr:PAS domain-containing sensor histidine kinase [Arenibacter nanhaiticus]SHI80239.1 PAS/PAC sensor signal transduction histidine kinase [Arenibacter nanhaiticus]